MAKHYTVRQSFAANLDGRTVFITRAHEPMLAQLLPPDVLRAHVAAGTLAETEGDSVAPPPAAPRAGKASSRRTRR